MHYFLSISKISSSRPPPSRGTTRSTGLASGGTTRPTGSSNAKATTAKSHQSSAQLTDHVSGGIHGRKRIRHSTGSGDEVEVRLDLDEAVQRLEKEMDDVTITSPSSAAGARGVVAVGGVASMRADSFHDDDILPGAAEHMGSGKPSDPNVGELP